MIGDGSASNSVALATIAGINAASIVNTLQDANASSSLGSAGTPLLSTSLSVGFQYEKSTASGASSVPIPTFIRAGDTVIIEATGGDINAVAAQILSGYDADGSLTGGNGDIFLVAGNDINLLSAQATGQNCGSCGG